VVIQGLPKAALLLGALALGLGFCRSSLEASPQVAPLTVRIEMAAGSHPAAGPICIRLRVTNVSKKPVLIAAPYWPVASLESPGDPELPDTRMVVEVKNSQGKILAREIQPLLGTRGIGRSDFTLLAPGASTESTFDLTRWPPQVSFPQSDEYTIRALLRFVGPEWLKRQKKKRSWIVDPDAISWLMTHEVPLFGGTIVSNEAKLRVCASTKASPCHPEVKPKKCYKSP
jgi:hypothetical protein